MLHRSVWIRLTQPGQTILWAIASLCAWTTELIAQTPAPLYFPSQTQSSPLFIDGYTSTQPTLPYAAVPPNSVWQSPTIQSSFTQSPAAQNPAFQSPSPQAPVWAPQAGQPIAPIYQPGPSVSEQWPPPTGMVPGNGSGWVDPYSYTPGQECCDPIREYILKFLGLGKEPDYAPGYYDPFSTQFAYGSAGVTPFQLGWYNKQELSYVPAVGTHGVAGEFQFTELNGWIRYGIQLDPQHLFTWTLVTNAKLLSGPSGVALGPDIDLVQSDFQFASNYAGPWNWQIGFTPQVNSDFDRQLTSDAYMFDGRAVVFNKVSQELTLALGVAYWDRNHGHLIPYGGLIWAPDDRWEFRAMFPKSRISYYLGNAWTFDHWIYGSAEYTLEAYQVALQDDTRIKERMELQDYRFLIGINSMRPRIASYLEGGLITDRHINFRGPTHNFTIGDTWIIRAGLLF